MPNYKRNFVFSHKSVFVGFALVSSVLVSNILAHLFKIALNESFYLKRILVKNWFFKSGTNILHLAPRKAFL